MSKMPEDICGTMTTTTRYKDDRLYCSTCREQPIYFRKILSWDVSQVTPDGTHVHILDADVEGDRLLEL